MSPLGFMALANESDEKPLAGPHTLDEAENHLRALLTDNYAFTTRTLMENRVALDAIAEQLIARETISGDDVRGLIAGSRS